MKYRKIGGFAKKKCKYSNKLNRINKMTSQKWNFMKKYGNEIDELYMKNRLFVFLK